MFEKYWQKLPKIDQLCITQDICLFPRKRVDPNTLACQEWNLEVSINKLVHLHEWAVEHFKGTQNWGKYLVWWNCPTHYYTFNINFAYPLKPRVPPNHSNTKMSSQVFRISPSASYGPTSIESPSLMWSATLSFLPHLLIFTSLKPLWHLSIWGLWGCLFLLPEWSPPKHPYDWRFSPPQVFVQTSFSQYDLEIKQNKTENLHVHSRIPSLFLSVAFIWSAIYFNYLISLLSHLPHS